MSIKNLESLYQFTCDKCAVTAICTEPKKIPAHWSAVFADLKAEHFCPECRVRPLWEGLFFE